MSTVYATEIASDKIASDNPIHQRLLKAYILSSLQVYGKLLEVGCGEGRGIDRLLPKVESYFAIDKIEPVIAILKEKYPKIQFLSGNIPPLKEYKTDFFGQLLANAVLANSSTSNWVLFPVIPN